MFLFLDWIDFLDYLLKFFMLVNVLVDFEENVFNCILIFFKVKEKMVLILEYLLGECKVILILRVYDSIK